MHYMYKSGCGSTVYIKTSKVNVSFRQNAGEKENGKSQA